MKLNNICGLKNVDAFVSYKLDLFSKCDKTMEALYNLMFSEESNIFAEETDGYRIKQTTYLECKKLIEEMTKKVSLMLKDIPVNSIIGLDLPNSINWIVLFWSILKSGYRPLLINSRLSNEVLNDVIDKYHVGAIICDVVKLDCLNITINDINNYQINDVELKSEFANEVFLMSSNTTGSLKICGYTGEEFYYQICDSGNIIESSSQLKKHYKGNLKLLTFLPLYHIFGLIAVYIWFTFFSRTLVFLKDNDPNTIVNTIKKHEVTHIFSVPLFWETIYKTAKNTVKSRGEKTYKKFNKGLKIYSRLAKINLFPKVFSKLAFKEVRENLFGDSICFLISGGGAISKETLLFFNAIGYHLANGYGATEIGITSLELSNKPKLLLKGSVGIPFSSLTYKIDKSGELLVKGKSTACSIYIDGIKQTVKNDEWYNTHDLCSYKKGKYYINGRIDDIIISGHGENVNPNFIEPKLKIGGIQNLCLFGVKERETTFSVLLVEVSNYLDTKQLKEILNNLRSIMEKDNLSYAVQKVVFTSSPLLDENEFKVNRKKIKDKYVNLELSIIDLDDDSINANIDTNLLTKVTEIFAEALDINADQIKKSAHFFYDLGGSSLEYFTMISSVQNEFNVPFPNMDQTSLTTVEQICEYIRETATQI